MFALFNKSVAVAVMSLAVLATGCGSSGQAKEKEAAVEGIVDVTKGLEKGQATCDKVVASIDQLQAGGDLNAAFKNYTATVAEVEAAGKGVASRRESMKNNREAYIAKWQKDLESIQNPDVRAALAERKQKVAADFDQIGRSSDALRDAYTPLLKDLQEIQKGLALDVNPAGVTAMKKPLDRAKAEATTLKAKIATLQGELTAIAGSMSGKAAPAK
ncbi:DUF2959 family protein [Humisphaera borealis]|uniref:DUF2959 family protein n=1 Tax=Humisphaera borealis TaxID=2807512 RepID=A0A7M2WUU6_9BACT|nr:DUF2959 family protein [Humisphaera borealis]QOV89305.1 DUF2959 family protein [Humisphaera borealis]